METVDYESCRSHSCHRRKGDHYAFRSVSESLTDQTALAQSKINSVIARYKRDGMARQMSRQPIPFEQTSFEAPADYAELRHLQAEGLFSPQAEGLQKEGPEDPIAKLSAREDRPAPPDDPNSQQPSVEG